MKKQYGVQIGLYRRYENAQYQLSQLINKDIMHRSEIGMDCMQL